jgi:DNA replicative helicase MCM subunit Mcm2 (Cdc46/Mcm family)
MGLFVFECRQCGHTEEHVYTEWSARPDFIECEKCGAPSQYKIVSGNYDKHPIRGLLEECSWLNDHAQVVSQEHYEATKGNQIYANSVIRTRKDFNHAMAAKGIREKPGLYNRTEV